MEHVNFSTTNEEKDRVINEIIDEVGLLKSKILVLDKTVAKKSWVGQLLDSKNKDKDKNKDKKG